jgi:hypothetical protein
MKEPKFYVYASKNKVNILSSVEIVSSFTQSSCLLLQHEVCITRCSDMGGEMGRTGVRRVCFKIAEHNLNRSRRPRGLRHRSAGTAGSNPA